MFHENVTLEVDLDDDGNTIIIKYNIGVKQGDTLAPVLFFCYIQTVLETLFPKFEAAGIEKLMFRSMQPKRAVNGEMAAGSLMAKPAVFHSSMCKAPYLPECMVVHTGSITIVPPSAGPTNCPKPYCGPPRDSGHARRARHLGASDCCRTTASSFSASEACRRRRMDCQVPVEAMGVREHPSARDPPASTAFTVDDDGACHKCASLSAAARRGRSCSYLASAVPPHRCASLSWHRRRRLQILLAPARPT